MSFDIERTQEVAQMAARIIAEEGVRDFFLAKQKAAQRVLKNKRTNKLPSNQQVGLALADWLSLFESSELAVRVKSGREMAVRLMAFFESFSPRLTGAVLSGVLTRYCPIELHVFAGAPEEVMLYLMDHDVAYELDTRRTQLRRGVYYDQPLIALQLEGRDVELLIFSTEAIRQPPPISPLDGSGMRRIDQQGLANLLARV